LLKGGLAAGGLVVAQTAGLGLSEKAFGVVRSGRPQLTNGVQSGDVTTGSAMVWGRADRRSRMLVDVATSPSFAGARPVFGPVVDESTDFTGKLPLFGLPGNADVFYRVRFADEWDWTLVSEPVVGHFRTAPTRRRTVSFVWGGDVAGQGWGIDESRGGMRTFATMAEVDPDFFIHSGDTIYADGPLVASVPLADGTTWRNLVTPEKAKVAETLAEYRGAFRYNLLDAHVRAFNAAVPVVAQWDDHETRNNWYPGQVLTDPRYTVTDVNVLAGRAKQAFHEYFPTSPIPVDGGRIYRRIPYGPLLDVFVLDMRTYRGPNTTDDQPTESDLTAFLGDRQVKWLLSGLRSSKATWKVIAADMPLGLVVPDGANIEAIGQGRPEALGRELETGRVLSGIKAAGVRNVVWLTADVHYAAAHHYDPARATYTDFDPFWEFVAGPLHAGTFGPNTLDPTFGPEAVFTKAAAYANQPPSDGNQFFGHVTIDGTTSAMTVRLIDVNGTTIYSMTLPAAR
jgi:alkaline phosphatase D